MTRRIILPFTLSYAVNVALLLGYEYTRRTMTACVLPTVASLLETPAFDLCMLALIHGICGLFLCAPMAALLRSTRRSFFSFLASGVLAGAVAALIVFSNAHGIMRLLVVSPMDHYNALCVISFQRVVAAFCWFGCVVGLLIYWAFNQGTSPERMA